MPNKSPGRWWARWDPRRSLRARFALIMGLGGLVLALALAAVIDANQRRLLEQGVRAAADREARFLGHSLSLLLEDRLGQVRRLAGSAALASGLMDAGYLRAALEQARAQQAELVWLAKVDRQGRVAAATGALLEGERLDDVVWLDQGLAQPWIGRIRSWPLLAQRLGDAGPAPRLFLELATPVIDAQGSTIGAVVALLDWTWVRERHALLTRPMALDEPADPDGPLRVESLLLADIGPSSQGVGRTVVLGPASLLGQALPQAAASNARVDAPLALGITTWPDGRRYLGAQAPLHLNARDAPGAWTLVLRQPADQALAAADRLSQRVLWLSLLASAAFAALSWWLAGRVVRPVEALVDTATRLQRGEAEAFPTAPPPEADDEVAALHAALRAMDGALRRQIAAERASAERFMALFESSPDGMYVSDGQAITLINPAGLRLLGARSADQVLGRPPADFFAPEEHEAMRRHGHVVRTSRQPMQALAHTLVRLDGQRLPVEVSLAMLMANEQHAMHVVLHDVTDRRRAEDALARHRDELEQRVAERTQALQAAMAEVQQGQQQLQALNTRLVAAAQQARAASEAKGAFLANMSHEVRTPMNAILGLSRLLLDEPLPPPARRSLQTLHTSCMALMTLLDDVLDYAKVEAGQLRFEQRPFRLREVLHRCIDLFEVQAAQRGLRLSLTVDPATPDQLLGDALRLSQVVNNLLGNAVKFTEAGQVSLQARGTVRPAAGDAPPCARLQIAVRDTGIGIDEAVQRQIFQPFTQADGSITRRYGGTGLGLAICKRLVELMSGEIGVDPAPGGGSVFWFTVDLPLAGPGLAGDPPAAPAAVDEPPGLQALGHAAAGLTGLEVLLAEDNPVNQLVAQETLARFGLVVHVVDDGLEALEAVRAEPGRFALVLMDLHMPRMDGLQACAAIRQLPGPVPPIVAMSAAVLPEDRARCLAAGMVGHLAKPFVPEQLLEALQRHAQPPGPVASRPGHGAAATATVTDARAGQPRPENLV